MVTGFEVEDSKSKGRISKLRHFIRQKRLFATKGYFSRGIGIGSRLWAIYCKINTEKNTMLFREKYTHV